MKAYFLWTVTGPQLILTSCDLKKQPICLSQTGRITKSVADKYIAYEVPLETIKQRYAEHFEHVIRDPKQTDELRILDVEGTQVLLNIHFSDLGQPIYYEPENVISPVDRYPDKAVLMYKKILIPLDGSQLAEVALPYVEELCGRMGSEVTLLHIETLSDDSYQHMHQFYIDKMVELTKQGAERHIEKSGRESTAIVKAEIVSGKAAEKIVEYADREGFGLIIMATHGQSGIKQWALGSVADKVVRATKLPVVLIRAEGARPDISEKEILNKILVPMDGSEAAEAVIPYVEEMASKLGTEVILLQVLAGSYSTTTYGYTFYTPLPEQQAAADKTSALDYLNTVAARLTEKGIRAATEATFGVDLKLGNAAEQIIQFAEKTRVDLVAMTPHGRSGLQRWVFGSVAERILREGNTPLLLVRPS
jgi:nucleotide-binding universal stress UspA family protein